MYITDVAPALKRNFKKLNKHQQMKQYNEMLTVIKEMEYQMRKNNIKEVKNHAG